MTLKQFFEVDPKMMAGVSEEELCIFRHASVYENMKKANESAIISAVNRQRMRHDCLSTVLSVWLFGWI